MNLREHDKRKYLILVILSGILAVLVFIAAITFIWTRPIIKSGEQIKTEDKELGSYSKTNFSLEDQVKVYSALLTAKLSANDSEELYQILNEEFINFNSFNKDSFNMYLSQKELYGKKLVLKEYKNLSFRNENIIKLSFESNDSDNISQIVTVFEKSPNNYTIAFDNFVAYIYDDRSYESNGLKIILSKQTYFTNEYIANIKITNVSNSNVILNRDKSAEIIYLNQGENLNTIVSSNMLMGETLTLEPNQSINYPIRFLISEFTFNSIKKIIIKDVTNESTNNTQDIEIDISNK